MNFTGARSNGGIPEDILDWISNVFSACNQRVTEKIAMAPNVSEPSLDQTWIEHMSRYSTPVRFDSGWQVAVESHYLGGLRHWGSWEIADIGILVYFRSPQAVRKRKVALLQSKRLYPTSGRVHEETRSDFEIGFGRLDDPEDESRTIGFAREFRFTDSCRYGAIEPRSEQLIAIDQYQAARKLRVYYQLYNPWSVPSVLEIPLRGYASPTGDPDLGIRVIPAPLIHAIVAEQSRSPSLADLAELGPIPQFGWRLETFVSEVLACREGDELTGPDDPRLTALFFRRSGPIAAAISITIESPDSDVVF